MGPAVETFLEALFFLALGAAALAVLTRSFWRRVARYFRDWQRRDEEREREEQVQRRYRGMAEEELRRRLADTEGRHGPDAGRLGKREQQ